MKNVSVSVHGRLLALAKQERVPFQRILTLYMQEGLLHRIGSTDYRESIALQGGLLFYQIRGMVARPTKDIDLLGSADDETLELLRTILDAASAVPIDDGIRFDRESVTVTPFRSAVDHGGVRGFIVGHLGMARTRLQIDMGFGDVVTGRPVSRPADRNLGPPY